MRSDIDQPLGTLKSVTDPKGQKVNYTYDKLKRVTAVSAAAGGKNYKNTYAYKDGRLQEAAHVIIEVIVLTSFPRHFMQAALK